MKGRFKRRQAGAVSTAAALMLGAIERKSKFPVPGRLAVTDDLVTGPAVTQARGKRAKRRRSAKMRARGMIHIDGEGWVNEAERMDEVIAAINNLAVTADTASPP